MRSLLVVLVAVVLDDDPGLRQGPELFAVQAFVPEATVEGLDEAILPRAAGLDVDRPDLGCGQPLLELLGDKLRSIVGTDVLRRPVLPDGALHAPWLARPADLACADDVVIGRDYPRPIVQHDEARAETLARYAVIKTASDQDVKKLARKQAARKVAKKAASKTRT